MNRRDPTAARCIDERDDGDFHCSMCGCSFDLAAFDAVGGNCPGCSKMSDVEDRLGLRGAL